MTTLDLFPNDGSSSSIQSLEERLGVQWENIGLALKRTEEKRRALKKALDGLDSPDTSIVAFGSLARGEFTHGSDIDWTLLVDGQATPEHLDTAYEIRDRIATAEERKPGREGIFGSLAFSHDIVHQIGGQADTNANTTQRILLLLESCVLGNPAAHNRVILNILDRYLTEDRGLWHGSGQVKVPRFLLNDIARYWRTMAVDLAYKQRTRGGIGFALRTIKLRISRKLIYMAGLLACFSIELAEPLLKEQLFSTVRVQPTLLYLSKALRQSPLEMVASTMLRFPELLSETDNLFRAYDDFLGILADDEKRKTLDTLHFDQLDSSPVFLEARKISYVFQNSVRKIFLDPSNKIGHLTIEYGVF